MKRPVVYILKCRTGKFYVGVTADLVRRMWEHNEGKVPGFTNKNGPCELCWFGEFQTMRQAIEFEKQIKGWRRDKKLAIIEERREDLPGLSVAYFRRTGTTLEVLTGSFDGAQDDGQIGSR